MMKLRFDNPFSPRIDKAPFFALLCTSSPVNKCSIDIIKYGLQ